jgi:UDP-N-acetylglucosamine 2-epimerase (non-hydrolysing)
MKIDLIAGARPNFMKIAPIIQAIKNAQLLGESIEYRLIHTGQHYDKNMSGSFFEQLEIPDPDVNLGAGGGTQAQQTASIMIGYETLLQDSPSDLCLVVGDVTSTMACAIVAQKMHIKVVHVEAGIRSNDWKMPEEINRLVTDSITNYFFTTTLDAGENLMKSGISSDNIFFVGNTMIDTLLRFKDKFIKPSFWDLLKLEEKKYIVMTLHRPANVDDEETLSKIIHEVINNAGDNQLVFPVHPRTKKILDRIQLSNNQLHLVDPLSYLEFNYLVSNSLAVVTDSGGITEETTVMGIPCLTLRDSTERPETITVGTNVLIGTNPAAIKPHLIQLLKGDWKKGEIPEKWDGHTAERIVEQLIQFSRADVK